MRSLCGRLAVVALTVWLLAGTCQGETMRLALSHPLEKVTQSWVAPEGGAALELEGAKGEVVSGQAVLLGAAAGSDVSASAGPLAGEDGKSVIDPGTVRLQWVRYLHLTANTKGVPADELAVAAPADVPDAFWDGSSCGASGPVQPLWVEISVPRDAAPGTYAGKVTISGSGKPLELPVLLRVRAFSLAAKAHQRVIQWWDFPGGHWGEVETGSDEYWRRLRQICRFVLDYRQTDIWAPWSLIKTETRNGKPFCDTSLFEKYVDTAFDEGVYAVHLQGVGRHNANQLQPGSRTVAVPENMEKLAAVQKLVAKRGWKGRILTALADEPFIYHEQSYRELLAAIRKVAPDVGTIEAVESEYMGDLDITVPKLSHLNLWWPHYEQMKREGKQVWFYTCCHPVGRYANRFLDQPLVAARELHWMNYLYGLDGYLHWGLNWFKAGEDPYSAEGRNTYGQLPPGDSQVAYPGKDGWLGSLRLAAMRDGLQDYEYLWTLENRISSLKKKLGDEGAWIDPRQRPLELCGRVVQSFYDRTRDPRVLLDTRAQVADEIEALADKPLLYVQTSSGDGARLPAGPIMVNVRGVAAPGASVKVNGQPVPADNVSKQGVFIQAVFLDAATQEIVVTAESNGVTRTAVRKFVVVD